MKTLEGCPALAMRHRATVEAAERAAASALAFAKLGRLRGAEPAQPMPPGDYECWATSDGLRVMHIRAAGSLTLGECDLRQIWPPLQADRGARHEG